MLIIALLSPVIFVVFMYLMTDRIQTIDDHDMLMQLCDQGPFYVEAHVPQGVTGR